MILTILKLKIEKLNNLHVDAYSKHYRNGRDLEYVCNLLVSLYYTKLNIEEENKLKELIYNKIKPSYLDWIDLKKEEENLDTFKNFLSKTYRMNDYDSDDMYGFYETLLVILSYPLFLNKDLPSLPR